MPSFSTSWWIVSLAAAFAAVIVVFLALFMPSPWCWITIGVGTAVFLYVLNRNPLYWYRRFAISILGSWFAITATSGVIFGAEIPSYGFAHFVANGVGPVFHIAASILIIVLLRLDFVRTTECILEVQNQVAHEVAPAATDLPQTVISRLSNNQIAKLLFQAIQSDTQYVAVDPDGLAKKAQAEIAITQVRTKAAVLIARERRWLLLAGVATVLIVTIGAVCAVALTSQIDKFRLRRDIDDGLKALEDRLIKKEDIEEVKERLRHIEEMLERLETKQGPGAAPPEERMLRDRMEQIKKQVNEIEEESRSERVGPVREPLRNRIAEIALLDDWRAYDYDNPESVGVRVSLSPRARVNTPGRLQVAVIYFHDHKLAVATAPIDERRVILDLRFNPPIPYEPLSIPSRHGWIAAILQDGNVLDEPVTFLCPLCPVPGKDEFPRYWVSNEACQEMLRATAPK